MRRFPIIIFVSIVISVSFTACKKNSSAEQKTTVGGIVVRFPTRQVVPGQKVYLVRQGLTPIQYDQNTYWQIFYLDTWVWPPKYRVDSTFTNASGRYSFAYNPADCQGYPCGGVFYTTVLDPAYVVVNVVQHGTKDTMFIDNPSYFKLNMHKTTAAVLNDTLFENRLYANDHNTGFGFYPHAFRKAQVGQTHTTIIDTFSYNAYNKVHLEWRHYKNGLMSSSIDTISLIPNGTKEYNVFY